MMSYSPCVMGIRINQVYKNRVSNMQILIAGKKGGKWKAKVLTEKPGVYAGTHSFAEFTLRHQFILIS